MLRWRDCGVGLWDDGGRCSAVAQVIGASGFFLDDRYFLVCAEVIGGGSGFEILARSQT